MERLPSFCCPINMALPDRITLYSSLEVEALQGNGSGILRIQDEVEMLVSAIQQTTHSMSRLAGGYPTSLHHFLYLFISFCTVKTTIEEPKKTTFTDLEL